LKKIEFPLEKEKSKNTIFRGSSKEDSTPPSGKKAQKEQRSCQSEEFTRFLVKFFTSTCPIGKENFFSYAKYAQRSKAKKRQNFPWRNSLVKGIFLSF